MVVYLLMQVSLSQVGEPGWLAGRIGEKSGWIPEAYLQKATDDGGADATEAQNGGRLSWSYRPVNNMSLTIH